MKEANSCHAQNQSPVYRADRISPAATANSGQGHLPVGLPVLLASHQPLRNARVCGQNGVSAVMPILTVIVGSIRPGRAGQPVAEWFIDRARSHGGFDVDVADLAE